MGWGTLHEFTNDLNVLGSNFCWLVYRGHVHLADCRVSNLGICFSNAYGGGVFPDDEIESVMRLEKPELPK